MGGMEHTSSGSGVAFIFGEGETCVVWDPSAFGTAPLESLFACTPEPDQRAIAAAAAAAAAAATPSPNPAVGPPTCASQAARASHFRARIDPNSDPFHDAGPGPLPSAIHTNFLVAPDLSNIARSFSANAARRPSAQPSLPTQHPHVGAHRVAPDHAANWQSFPPNSSPDSSWLPHHQIFESPFNLESLGSHGEPYRDLTVGPPTSTGAPQWTAPASSAVDTSSNDHYCPSSPSPVNSDTRPSSGIHRPLSPSARLSQDAISGGHGRCASSTFAPGTVAAIDHLPTQPNRSKQNPTTSATPLAVVHYKPSGGPRGKSPKEGPAFGEHTPRGMASRTLRQVLVRDGHGEVQGAMITFGNPIKTRSVLSEEKRQRTAQARREGVCARCKKSKRQCNLSQQRSKYTSCTLCTGTKLYKNAPRLPCFKATLADILFFRSGPAENEPFFTKRRVVYELGDLSKPEVPVRTLKLTQNVGPHDLTVYVAEFVPVPGDVVSYKWRDNSGSARELAMPPFCLTKIEKIHSHFRKYIAAAKWTYLRSLESEDQLAWMTVSTAIDYAKRKPDSLVADTLDLWAISRMIELPWQMSGADTLGVSPVRDATSPHNGKTPVPPIMDTQLDQIVIQSTLNPLRARVVRKFEQLITPAKPEAWWEIYLSAFILLNHIEHLAKHSMIHAKMHTMRTKYSNVPFLEGVFHTAKSILARFHFICNGSAPLTLDWTSPKAATMAQLDQDQVAFMQSTQTMITARVRDIRDLQAKHKYEKPLYWSGQLFFEDFDTSPVHVVEEVGDEEGRSWR